MFLMALALEAITPQPEPMTVRVVRDPITDQIRAYATVRDGGNRLVVSCAPSDHQGARVSVHARRWLARGNFVSGYRSIVYRFDDLPPERIMWDVKARHASLRGPSRVARFLGELPRASRLVIRTRDVEDRRYDLTFRLSGVQPALEHMFAACRGAGSAVEPDAAH